MSGKANEPFNPEIKSEVASEKLLFRLAKNSDADVIARLMHIRNPFAEYLDLLKNTNKEIAYNSTDELYRVFVAELDGRVVGFCRYYHSKGIKSKKVYPAPEGFYCMGIIVDPNVRRKSIARFLSEKRFEWLSAEGIEEVYSCVAGDNPTSLTMHEKFGFERVKRVPGVHHIPFDCGYGYLFLKNI
jgi:ribosomal protein S18 acetylase RimI-like enzyme